jgi:hypothetical protein
LDDAVKQALLGDNARSVFTRLPKLSRSQP